MDRKDDIEVEIPEDVKMDRLPEKSFDMEELKKCIVYDVNRTPVYLSELMNGDYSAIIFVFIRHFLDYVTREYVEDFAKIFPHILRERDVKIILIGCAPARFIRQFTEETSCPHQIYCDSTRTIYNCLGLNSVPVEFPKSQSPHIKTNSFVGFWQTVWRAMRSQTEQGNTFQLGGQIVISNKEEVLYFYRDRHVLDHTPINDLLAVAGLPRIDFCTKYKIKHV